MKISKPWGYKLRLGKFNTHYVDILRIREGTRTSRHVHLGKEELMFCIVGELRIEIENEVHYLHEGDSITVPSGKIHRLEAVPSHSTRWTVIVEISEVDEKTSERIEDDYGRTN